MIQYQYTEGSLTSPIPVKFNNRRVGTIKPVKGGWQYFPLNHKKGGEIFSTITEVQKSLEFDDEE